MLEKVHRVAASTKCSATRRCRASIRWIHWCRRRPALAEVGVSGYATAGLWGSRHAICVRACRGRHSIGTRRMGHAEVLHIRANYGGTVPLVAMAAAVHLGYGGGLTIGKGTLVQGSRRIGHLPIAALGGNPGCIGRIARRFGNTVPWMPDRWEVAFAAANRWWRAVTV